MLYERMSLLPYKYGELADIDHFVVYDTPGTPLIRDSPPIQGNDVPTSRRVGADNPQRDIGAVADAEHLDYLHNLSNEVADSSDGCPDFNLDFWMFLEGQNMWSN